MASRSEMDVLFPLPSPPPSPLCPGRLPGITHESKVAVTKALKENHEQRHAFVNEYGFHNHASHHLLATFALGAPAPLYDLIYDLHVKRTFPVIKSPGVIKEENFYDHLGDTLYYDAYLQYFHHVVIQKGPAAAIEEYVFAHTANSGGDLKRPRHMLNRMYGRLCHPMIYIGYGLEFGMPGLVAEGLAQTAVHPPTQSQPATNATIGTDTDLTERLSSLFLDGSVEQAADTSAVKPLSSTGDVHAFTVLARILQDDRFAPFSLGLTQQEHPEEILLSYDKVDRVRGKAVLSYAEDWLPNGSDAKQVESKIEELHWMNTLLYGVGSWGRQNQSADAKFAGDFFFMHMVNSSLFLPSFVAHLKPSSISVLLRSYFVTCLTWWVARGRPNLPIRKFYASVSATSILRNEKKTKSGKGWLKLEDAVPNPWLPIVETAIVHSDDHLCKMQRTFAHFASRFGARPAGYFADLAAVGNTKLDGLELLDGTLFERAAALTAERGEMIGQTGGDDLWSFEGFFN